MRDVLYLAWRYLSYHRVKTGILVTAVTLILYLPVGLRVLVDQSSRQLTARAAATPLIVGARGSPLELVLNTLYFASDDPEPTRFAQSERVQASGLATAIPFYARFEASGRPIVGTTLDYFAFRALEIADGRQFALLGEAVLGSRAAQSLGLGPGDHITSSPEGVFDIAGVYPLKMSITGVLGFSDSADDDAVFIDLKTAWVIQGLGHGHQDLSRPAAVGAVLSREGNTVVANASIVQYHEITEENIASFHFHGDLSNFPISAVIADVADQRSSALLQGRYQAAEDVAQIVAPPEVMSGLLDTILTVERFVVAGAVIVGLATLATAALVFMLSLRLRRRERETMFKIGGSRPAVASVMFSEIGAVLTSGLVLAAGLTWLTSQYGALAIRLILRS